jgi:hypothetical protein
MFYGYYKNIGGKKNLKKKINKLYIYLFILFFSI